MYSKSCISYRTTGLIASISRCTDTGRYAPSHINCAHPLIDTTLSEEVLNELHRSQEVAYNLRDQARQNYVTRGKLCSKIIKYPHIEDYTVRSPPINHQLFRDFLVPACSTRTRRKAVVHMPSEHARHPQHLCRPHRYIA